MRGWQAGAAAAFCGVVFNTLWVQATGNVSPYCGVRWAVLPLFATWWHWVLPVLTATLLYVLFAGKGWREVVLVIFLIMMTDALPKWLDDVGTLGRGCT